jgi:hypothetical protein
MMKFNSDSQEPAMKHRLALAFTAALILFSVGSISAQQVRTAEFNGSRSSAHVEHVKKHHKHKHHHHNINRV